MDAMGACDWPSLGIQSTMRPADEVLAQGRAGETSMAQDAASSNHLSSARVQLTLAEETVCTAEACHGNECAAKEESECAGRPRCQLVHDKDVSKAQPAMLYRIREKQLQMQMRKRGCRRGMDHLLAACLLCRRATTSCCVHAATHYCKPMCLQRCHNFAGLWSSYSQ
jgi:hypothetical protein